MFRSDTLHRLTTADLEHAQELGVRTVIDLRSTDELTEWGRFAHADSVAFHHLPLFEDDAMPSEPIEDDDPEPPLGETYLQMAAAGGAAIASRVAGHRRGRSCRRVPLRGRKGPHGHPRGAPAVDARRRRRPDRGGLSAQRARGGAHVPRGPKRTTPR